MQIEDTRWYTAVFLKAHELSETGTTKIERINGYRMKLAGWSEEEIREHVNLLIAEGVKGKVRTSKQNHTDIPAGEPFFQVSDKESIKNLEKIFKESGVALNPDRFHTGYEHLEHYTASQKRSR